MHVLYKHSSIPIHTVNMLGVPRSRRNPLLPLQMSPSPGAGCVPTPLPEVVLPGSVLGTKGILGNPSPWAQRPACRLLPVAAITRPLCRGREHSPGGRGHSPFIRLLRASLAVAIRTIMNNPGRGGRCPTPLLSGQTTWACGEGAWHGERTAPATLCCNRDAKAVA